MERNFKIGETVYSVLVSGQENPVKATIDGNEAEFIVNQVSENEFVFTRDGRQTRLFLARNKDGETFVHHEGKTFKVCPVEDDFGGGEDGAAASGKLVAAMPGRIIKVLVEAGQEVEKNQPVLIMESMKMEITQNAPFHGKVEEVNAKAGQQVDAGSVMVRIEPIDQPANS